MSVLGHPRVAADPTIKCGPCPYPCWGTPPLIRHERTVGAQHFPYHRPSSVDGVLYRGGLAAGTVLLARDRGSPAIFAQVLIWPMIDDRNDTFSAQQMEGIGIWDLHANEAGWTAMLGERRGSEAVSIYAAPARAEDLTGLPPAYIECTSVETFRDEDVAYANRIWQAGGVCDLHVWAGGFHGVEGMVPDSAISVAMRQTRINFLERILRTHY